MAHDGVVCQKKRSVEVISKSQVCVRVVSVRGVCSSIHGLRAEFHPSKVEIRVRVPVDALFWSWTASVCGWEQNASAAGLEPATPRSEVWCASDCAMRPPSCVWWRVGIEEKKAQVMV